MRRLAFVALIATVALSCTGMPRPAAQIRPSATASPASTPAYSTQPMLSSNGALAWDGVDGRMMYVEPSSAELGFAPSLWTFDGSRWQPSPAPAIKPLRAGFGRYWLGYDEFRDREVLVATEFDRVETWEWDSKSWRQVVTRHSARGFVTATYSPDLRALVGWDGTVYFDDMWVYDGTDWRTIRTTSSPFEWGVIAMAYDPIRHGIVALAERDFTTWFFGGQDWYQIPRLGNPLVFSTTKTYAGGAVAALDPQTSLWVVVGNWGGSENLGDTWIGDGGAWSKAAPASAPSPPGSIGVWDPTRQQVVMFGGSLAGHSTAFADMAWAWDGFSWTQVAGPGAPAPSKECIGSASYGLMIAGGKLEIIDTCGKVRASAPVAPPSVASLSLSLQPPVSATNDKVFYRDGDTKIRSLGIDGRITDVTSVPGGRNTVSFFSVSPDDERIAVLTEDLSGDTIHEHLYVEDLRGDNHADVYSTTQPNTSAGTTLWPMGWHDGRLVLALMSAAAGDESAASPLEWHVSDVSTGNRIATIARCPDNGITTYLSHWPTKAGVVCVAYYGVLVYDLSGKQLAGWTSLGPGDLAENTELGLSPAGDQIFMTHSYGTVILTPHVWGADTILAKEFGASLWIDNSHLLAPNGVIEASRPRQTRRSPRQRRR